MAGETGVLGDAWLRAAWEAATDAMALSDPDGRVLAANPAYYKLYGYSTEEVIGHSFAVIFPEPVRAAAEAQYREVFRGPAQQGPFESVVRRRDGTERIVEARISFVEEDGRRVAMLNVVRDSTEEVNARRAVEQAERVRRDFLSNLSHDIKSPLAAIKGQAQMLRGRLARHDRSSSPERLTAGLSQIEASAMQVAGLLDEVVEVSGLAGGGAPTMRPSPVDLVALARDAVERYQHLADEHQLVLQAAVETVAGHWDAARLQRVLDNLIGNAIKYSPRGGQVTVGITLGVPPSPAGESGTTEPARDGPKRAVVAGMSEPFPLGVLLRVQDQGVGISTADLPYVFERFRRGGNVADSVGGSGIGLSSVQQIVQEHGGRVGVASREGAGTTVSVWLPLQSPPPTDEGSE